MSGEVKLENEEALPSVDDVVAAMAERGITTFASGDAGEVVDVPEVEITPEDLQVEAVGEEIAAEESGADGDGDSQSETLPEAEPETQEVGGENVSDEPVPVARPSSSQYVDFLERQREINERAHTLDTRKIEAEDRVKALQEELDAFKSKPKPQSPMEALRAQGYTYEEATEQILGGWEPPKVDPVDEKVGAVQSELAKTQELVQQLTAKLQEREQADLQARALQAKEAVLGDIREISSESEFEYLNSVGDAAYEAVNNLMLEYYNTYKTALDIKDACAIIDEQYAQMFGGLFKSEKLLKAQGLSKAAVENEQKQEAAKPAARKTLTNKRTASAPARNQVDSMSNLEAQDEVAKMLVFKD